LFALPFLLEGMARVRAVIKYGSTKDVFDIYELDPSTGLRTPIPGTTTTLAGGSSIAIDSRGFRSPELRDPKPAGAVRLAFLGDSTTLCVEAADNAHTWPHQAVGHLARARSEIEFDYVNAAVNAYSVEDSLARFEARVAALEPDVVVIYQATRDIAKDTRELAIAAGLAEPRHESWLEHNSLLWHQLLLNARYLAAQREASELESKLSFDVEPLARRFGERLTRLDRTRAATRGSGRARDLRDALEPRAAAAEQLENLRHAFTFTPYLTPQQIFDCYDAYNAQIRAVASRTNAVLVEASELSGCAELFVDSVHFDRPGCEAMAKLVADAVLASPRFGALADARSTR
jgi:lysophospholipase L1-like esterase